MKAGAAVTTPVGVGYTIGPAVPSDQRATGTRKMVSGSGTSLSSRTTGEPGRLAPQYLSQNTRPKKPGARPWMRHTLVHNGLRVSRDRVRYATSRLDETRAVVRFERH